jgi:hypothetical protein
MKGGIVWIYRPSGGINIRSRSVHSVDLINIQVHAGRQFGRISRHFGKTSE